MNWKFWEEKKENVPEAGVFSGNGWYWVNSEYLSGLYYVRRVNDDTLGAGVFPYGGDEFETWANVGPKHLGKKVHPVTPKQEKQLKELSWQQPGEDIGGLETLSNKAGPDSDSPTFYKNLEATLVHLRIKARLEAKERQEYLEQKEDQSPEQPVLNPLEVPLQDGKEAKSTEPEQSERFPFFKGYPYLVIRISKQLFHINLLSEEDDWAARYAQLAQAQADANKFEVCLVLAEDACAYYSSKHDPYFSKQIPKGGIFIIDKLRLEAEPRITTDFLQRRKELDDFIQNNTPKAGYIMGDLQKGGREASYEEVICLRGVQENGLPKGLAACPVCGDYRGACLDPSPNLSGLVVKVSCYCSNDSICAHCWGKLNDRKPDSNHYEPKDGKIWHTPSFCGLSHKCPGT